MKAATKTLKIAARNCAALLTAGLLSSAAFAQDTAATIPTSFLGTYNLTYDNAQTGSPVANGTAVQVVIAANNTLCLGGYTLTNPVIRNGNGHEAIWTEGSLGIEISLSSLLNGFNEINVGPTGGGFYGQLKGSKSSTSTTGCGAVTTPAPDMTKINELFALAQAKFAQYFPSSANAVNQELDGFIYRAYPDGIYLAINNGDVYVMGGTFGNEPSKQGSLEAILSELAGTDVDIDIPDAAQGDYKLVVSGDITVLGIKSSFGGITIDKIAAPSATDIPGIRDAVKASLKDINFVGTIEVSEVTTTDSAFSFRIAFTGTSSGVNINYNLLYNYTKL